jgi:hypothetical protein
MVRGAGVAHNYPMGKKFSGSVDKGYQNNQKPDIAYD